MACMEMFRANKRLKEVEEMSVSDISFLEVNYFFHVRGALNFKKTNV